MERQILYITYKQNLKYGTNEPIYEAETESGTYRIGLWLPRGKGLGEGWSRRLVFSSVQSLSHVRLFVTP